MTDPQKRWDEYYSRIKDRRLEEAKSIWFKMEAEGVKEDTVLALDFFHFSQSKNDLTELRDQLSENYEVSIEEGNEDYYYLKGTTRPYGIELSKESFEDWIDFMCDVSQSYACVFSTWTIEASSLEMTWTNEKE